MTGQNSKTSFSLLIIDVLPYAILADIKTVFWCAYLKSLCNGEELDALFSISEEESPFTFTVFMT